MADGPVFPAFLKIEHQADNSAKASFLAEVASFTTDAKRQFERDFGEIRQVINKSLTSFRGGKIALDIDVSGLRQTAAEADLTVQKLRLMRDAATSLASSTGDTSSATQRYLSALRAQVIEAEQAQRVADAQVTTYSRLQAEIDKQVAGNTRLAQSYRDAQIAANLANETYERRGPGPAADMRSGVDRLRDGAASIDRAALSGTTLEQVLGRVSSKSVEVSGALQQARKAEDDLSRATAALRAELDPTVAAQQRMVTQTELLDRALKQGSIDAVEHARLQKLVGEQYELNTIAAQRSVGTQRALRQATLQSGQQIQDIAISLYSGQQASVVFAQQLPQLAFGLSGLEGSANKTHDRIGRFASFLSGPWGIAVGLAVGVIGTLISRILEVDDAADGAETSSRALGDGFNYAKLAASELISSINELEAAQRKQLRTSYESAEAAKTDAEAALKAAKDKRDLAKAELEVVLARYYAQSSNSKGGQEIKAGLGVNAASIEAMITRLDQATAKAERLVRETNVPIARRQAEARSNPDVAATIAYEAAEARVRKQYEEGRISLEKYTNEVDRLGRVRDAAIKAARDAERAQSSSNRQYGREIDVGEARSIAAGAGFRVTSGLRSRAEQQRLYDTVRTPQNPVALPGTSAHEKGNALDIAFGSGVSPASIRKAFQDEGVRLTKILKETGHYHIEWSTSGADKAVREAKQVEDYGKRAAETIVQITSRFDEQPRAIDQAAAATRELNRVIAELGEQRPAGFEKLIADAKSAKTVVEDALVRPFREMAQDSDRRLQVQALISQGRDTEAEALQRIWQMEERLGPLTADRKREIYDIAKGEAKAADELSRQMIIQNAYLDATRSVRQEVEAILSGQGKFSNFKAIFRDLQGKVLTEQIFGDVFRDLDTWVKRNTGVGRATDEFTRATDKAGSALEDLAKRVDAIGSTAGTGMSGASAIGAADSGAAIDALLSGRSVGWHGGLNPPGTLSAAGAANDNFDPNADIVVIANKGARLPIDAPKGTLMAMSPKDYVDGVSAALGARFLDALNATFGTSFFSRFQGVLSGAAGGYVSGGVPGGIIGAIGSIKGLPKELSKTLGKAGEGAATGTAAAGIMKALGIKTSTTGAQIGGAIGSAIPIPGGDIIGSIIGGLVGGLFKKTKYGSATIGSVNGVLGVTGTTGNSGQYIKAAGENADSILAGIDRIAQALGATVNASAGAVSIGYYKGKVRVDPTGAGRTKSQVDFGKDGLAAAIQYATLDLIKDGVLTGLRQGTQTLLKNAKDLDTGLQKAVDFEGVFAQLKAIKDPVGAALDGLDKEFVRLKGVFTEAGANAEELASLEELYGLKRVEAVKQANEQIIGSMKSLLSDLKTGDNGLSLKDREAAARAAYDPLAARVRAGDVTAAEDFTAAARTLLDIERQIYGSQQPYFNVFNEIKTLSQTMVDTQEAIATASANRDSPFSKTTSAGTDNASVVNAIDSQTNALVSELKAANDNLISILQKLSASGVNLAGGIAFNGSF